MNADSSRQEALQRMRLSLEGFSLGDALGEMFFGSPRAAGEFLKLRPIPPPSLWRYTDDTEMALAIAEVLTKHGQIDQYSLAHRFASRYMHDPDRGSGRGTRAFCEWVGQGGVSWEQASAMTFKGGSYGNGSAMRVAPLGGYFANSHPVSIAWEAKKSAEVTHRHPEGIAGAVAVAVAAAVAWQQRNSPVELARKAIFEALVSLPDSKTLQGIKVAAVLDTALDPEEAGRQLGNGSLVTCPDTVPYVIWSACRKLNDFTQAIVDTLAGGGDTDTTCAMVGGIVALHVGMDGIPAEFLERREKLSFE